MDRQEAECRELAKRLGWKVVAIYVDNDISAYSRYKRRPQYQEICSKRWLLAKSGGFLPGIPTVFTAGLSSWRAFISLIETHEVSSSAR